MSDTEFRGRYLWQSRPARRDDDDDDTTDDIEALRKRLSAVKQAVDFINGKDHTPANESLTAFMLRLGLF
ncbi:hypothetical protein JQ543_05505 [Bradyrhizobium diazoefficiens]|nr:hypothetical protein [Bradyrhizobium diazoefficiens]MBR0847198.1 hypothetical protein [Bradyrhizobium diazoefficiens]